MSYDNNLSIIKNLTLEIIGKNKQTKKQHFFFRSIFELWFNRYRPFFCYYFNYFINEYFLSVFIMVFMYEILTFQNNDTIIKGS